jgi:hypothetical protein
LGGLIVRNCTGDNRTDTLPSATSIAAAMNGVAIGVGIRLLIKNVSDFPERLLILIGAGMSDEDSQSQQIRPRETGEFLLVFTDVTAGAETMEFHVINTDSTSSATELEASNMVTFDPSVDSGTIIVQTPGLLAAGAVYPIVVTHSGATNRMLVSVTGYGGVFDTAGFPVVSVSGVTTTEFTVQLMNAHHTNAFTNDFIIIAFNMLR